MRPATRILSSLFVTLLASPLLVEAQTPRGPEITVTAVKPTPHFTTDTAVSANGGFVVTWQTGFRTVPPQPSQARFRLFRPDGTPRTAELRVSNSPWNQYAPSVDMMPDGRFLVAWCENVPDHLRVLARRFAADGTPLGAPFRLSRTLAGDQCTPDVELAADGSFIAAWESSHIATLPRHAPDIFARRFTAEGRPRGPEFLVNTDTGENQTGPQVAIGADGAFVIGWVTWNGEGDFYDVAGRQFAVDGTPKGEELLLVDDPVGGQATFGLATTADGGFVVVWGDPDADPFEGSSTLLNGILGWRYGADGTPAGPVFHVNVTTPGVQTAPSITPSPTGFFVVWQSQNDVGTTGGIFGRRLAPDGTPVGPEIRLSGSAASSGGGPVVALNANGRGAVAWTGFPAFATYQILARRLVQARPPQ